MFGGFGRGRKPEPSMADLFGEMLREGGSRPSTDRVANTPEQLRAAYAVFAEQHTFKPGDLVMWKAGHKNRKIPEMGEPAIVIEVYATPLRSDRDSGSNVFNEPLDLVLGLIDADGDFTHWHFDSRRFQPYTEE